MFADLLTLKPAPIVGARRVRPLGISESKAELEYQLAEKKAEHNAALASRARALAAYKAACRAVNRVEYGMAKTQKKLARIGDGND